MKKTVKKILVLVLVMSMIIGVTGCAGIKDAAKETMSTISSTASNVKDSVVNWYKQIDFSAFKRGWDHAVDFVSSTYGAAVGSEFVQDVSVAINNFKVDINQAYGSARGVAQEAGFAAEKWAADTFNIDAAVRGSKESASVVGSTGLGSVDVSTTYGEEASLKYYNSANSSADEQARVILDKYAEYKSKSNNPKSLEEYLTERGYDPSNQNELMASIYAGQTRIIPSDQLENAIAFLKGQIEELDLAGTALTDAQAANYRETLEHLRDRLQAPDGTESTPATYEEMQAVAELAKEGEFKPEDFGISVTQLITPKYIVKRAIGAGISTALINAVLTIGPDIYSILSEAYKTGEFNEDELKEVGVEGLIAGSEGFVEGSVSCALVTMCKAGKFGAQFKDVSPNVIGILTVITIDAIRYGYSLSKGQITATDFSNLMAEEIVIAACGCATGTLLQTLLPMIPFAYLAGSFAGSICASIGYSMLKEVVLEIKDCEGFPAVVSAGILNTLSVAKDKIASLGIKEMLSDCKDLIVSTVDDGYIRVQAALAN